LRFIKFDLALVPVVLAVQHRSLPCSVFHPRCFQKKKIKTRTRLGTSPICESGLVAAEAKFVGPNHFALELKVPSTCLCVPLHNNIDRLWF
jgi:hypothetical protein